MLQRDCQGCRRCDVAPPPAYPSDPALAFLSQPVASCATPGYCRCRLTMSFGPFLCAAQQCRGDITVAKRRYNDDQAWHDMLEVSASLHPKARHNMTSPHALMSEPYSVHMRRSAHLVGPCFEPEKRAPCSCLVQRCTATVL